MYETNQHHLPCLWFQGVSSPGQRGLFGVDYDLLSMLMTRETDDEGHLRIHWGEQKIA